MEQKEIKKGWQGFVPGLWMEEINVRDFIQRNYQVYEGDDAFLEGPTESTKELWEKVLKLSREEMEKGGVLDMDTEIISGNPVPRAWISGKRTGKNCGISDGQAF